MEIHVKAQNNNEGLSQAIKRKLIEAGAKEENLKGANIWEAIRKELGNDENNTIGDKKIGDVWTTLNAAVKTVSNMVIKIADATWNKIKELVGISSETQTPEVDDKTEDDEKIETSNKTQGASGAKKNGGSKGYKPVVGQPSRYHKGFTIDEIREDGTFFEKNKDGTKYLYCDNNGCVLEAQIYKDGKCVKSTHYENGKPTETYSGGDDKNWGHCYNHETHELEC